MKPLKLFGIYILIGISFSCNKDENELAQKQDQETLQVQEAQSLNQMFLEIENLAMSENCDDSSEWNFISYGSKACGGPIGYIAYSLKIDTSLFIKKVEDHRIAQDTFNKKWGIISDCSIPAEPKGIICENEKAVLEY